MSNLEISSRLIQKTKNNLTADHLDPGGKTGSNPIDQFTTEANKTFERTSVPHDEHLKESGTSSVTEFGKNSVSLKRNEIEKCITLLKHAMQCKKADCDKKSCSKMKRLSIHIKRCRKENHHGNSIESCQLCKQFIALCCYHAKRCDQQSCSIPYCGMIKKRVANGKRALKRIIEEKETCGICLEPFQQKKINSEDNPEDKHEAKPKTNIEEGLPKLREMFPDCSVTQCGHLFHSNCLSKWQKHQKIIMKSPNCPYCRTVFSPL